MSIEQVLDEIEKAHLDGEEVSLVLTGGRLISIEKVLEGKKGILYSSNLMGTSIHEKLKMLLDEIFNKLEKGNIQVEEINLD